jgi:hypothetical protein
MEGQSGSDKVPDRTVRPVVGGLMQVRGINGRTNSTAGVAGSVARLGTFYRIKSQGFSSLYLAGWRGVVELSEFS